jgi:hypothetical protein
MACRLFQRNGGPPVKRIVSLAAGVAVGYVLGSRAGREKYEQIAAAARRYAGSSTAEGQDGDGDAPARSRRTVSASAPRERFTGDTASTASSPTIAHTASTPGTASTADTAEKTEAESEREELRVAAKELVEDLPGETALGNRDPAAGGHGDPKEYEGR